MSRRGAFTTIYKISFPNGKMYIGLTCASLRSRKMEHLSRAKKGSSLPVHNALRKYGESVVWEVLETVSDYEQGKVLEIKHIANFNAIEKGYNLTKGGDGSFGYKQSDSQKLKSSLAHKGYKMPNSQKESIRQSLLGIVHSDARRVLALNIKTDNTMIYRSITLVGKDGFSRSCVSRVCRGERKSHKGYTFKYLED